MQRVSFLFILFFNLLAVSLTAQDTLPRISVRNLNGQIIVSWINNYKVPVTTINVQRSYDSLKNYTTIGSVLSPQNFENGYADTKPRIPADPRAPANRRISILLPFSRPPGDANAEELATNKRDSLVYNIGRPQDLPAGRP